MTTRKIILIGSVSVLAIAIGYYFYSKKQEPKNQTDPAAGKPNTSNGVTVVKPGATVNPNNLSTAELVHLVTSGRGR